MDEQRFLVSMRDIEKYRVLMDCLEKTIKATQASQALGLSYIHTLRLKKKVAQSGLEGLLRPYRPSPKKIPIAKAKLIGDLYKDRYSDFNVLHFKDKLADVHKVFLSYESIRQILISAGLHNPKKKKKVHRRRRRMPKTGMLVQMDSSQHKWLEHIPEEWWLIAMIDDASNEVPYAQFFPKDTLFANMHVIRRFIELKGLFMALYADKASHFKTTRHGGIHYHVNPEQEETQIERALNELDINLIPANSPQAKGRIERLFGFLQDRLIKEMRLAGVKNYTQANRFLSHKFLPWYNPKYTHEVESAYIPLPADKNLDLIFCIKKERKVKADNTIQIDGQTIQIPPTDTRLSFTRAWVEVCILQDRRTYVLYKGSIIAESKLSKNRKISRRERQIETLLNAREYASHNA
jgi:hypothetical protein